MKKVQRLSVGIDQGEVTLFSEIENGGEMWTGDGPREIRAEIAFTEAFAEAPKVHVSPAMWDIDHASNSRFDLGTVDTTTDGFVVRFRTWGDTRVGRVRVSWLAIGPVADDDVWDV